MKYRIFEPDGIRTLEEHILDLTGYRLIQIIFDCQTEYAVETPYKIHGWVLVVEQLWEDKNESL
jgi:hypothetical protein